MDWRVVIGVMCVTSSVPLLGAWIFGGDFLGYIAAMVVGGGIAIFLQHWAGQTW